MLRRSTFIAALPRIVTVQRHYVTCVNLVIDAICCALSCDKVIGYYLGD